MKFLFLAFVSLLIAPLGFAEVKTSAPQKSFFTVQEHVNYDVYSYTPALDLLSLDVSEQEIHRTPENVAATYISSMVFTDYDRHISLWEPEERKRLMAKHALNGQTEKFWKELWIKTFAEISTISMKRKVVQDNFVIIEVVANGAGGNQFAVDVPIIHQNKYAQNNYYITDKLEKSPLYAHWRQAGQVVTK